MKMQKQGASTSKFIPPMFFPTDEGRFLGNFLLPGGKEWLGKTGVCYIFKLGTFGGGRLSGWFTASEGWMRLSGAVVWGGGGVIL